MFLTQNPRHLSHPYSNLTPYPLPTHGACLPPVVYQRAVPARELVPVAVVAAVVERAWIRSRPFKYLTTSSSQGLLRSSHPDRPSGQSTPVLALSPDVDAPPALPLAHPRPSVSGAEEEVAVVPGVSVS